MVNPQIFRAYDIRGIVDKDLNPEVAELIGRAFGTYLKDRNVVVGRDARQTSEQYQNSLIKGLLSTGCNVFDIGLTLSPILYFSRQHFKIDGGIMITASHNPMEWNGFKLCHGIGAISGQEIQKVKDILLSNNFKQSKGKRSSLNAWPEYLKEIKERIKLKRPLKVVVDCYNDFVPELLEELGCEVIHFSSDFTSNPADLSHYSDLVSKVKQNKADIGIILDQDSDRAGFVDEKGNIWKGDMILVLLMRKILPNYPGRKVIVEVKNSEFVVEEARKLKAVPIFWKTGHSLIDKKVFEEKAILAGETSCHYWICDNWYCFDDGLYAAARVLEIISKSNSFSELMSGLPVYIATPEYRIPVPEHKKFQIVEDLVSYFRKICKKTIELDGIRGYLEDGWFLIRASNTQPFIVVRAEAKTEKGLEKIKQVLRAKYPFSF